MGKVSKVNCPKCKAEDCQIILSKIVEEQSSIYVENGTVIAQVEDQVDVPNKDMQFTCHSCYHQWIVPDWIRELIEW